MKHTHIIAGLALAATLAGCCSAPQTVPPQPLPLPPAPAPVELKNTGDKGGFEIVSEANTKLRVLFTSSAAESAFASRLAQDLAEGINSSGNIRLVGSAPYDLSIAITPLFEVFDTDGEYVRIKCSRVSIAVSPAVSGNKELYSVKNIVPADMPRQLGAQRAKDQYLKPVAKEALPFLNKELARIADTKIAATEIKFQMKNWNAKPDAAELAHEAAKIKSVLDKTPGIISFQNISQNNASATCTYRVVYMKDAFPQGLVNDINSKLAAIK